MIYTSRLFSDVDDIDRITGFVRSIRTESLWSEYPSLWDLPYFLAIPKNQETTRLWFMEDGSLAAYMLGQVNEREAVEGTAVADLFATHPDFRGLGLAKVLMGEVLRRLQAKGFRRAKLSTGSSNTAMVRIAQTYGFQVEGRTFCYWRQVQEVEL